MRLMLRFTIPVERGNQAQLDDSLSMVLKSLIDELKPEAAYFHLDDGKRAGTLVFEETDQSRLAIVNESLFKHCHAAIDIQPVLNLDDLMKGLE